MILLCKYGEIVLKGLNRHEFERTLLRNLNRKLKPFGRFHVRASQSTIYVEPTDMTIDMAAVREAVSHVFGFVSLSLAKETVKDMAEIRTCAVDYTGELLAQNTARTFKVTAKRSDKAFVKNSPAICAEVGEAILDAYPNLKVDLRSPDVYVHVEVRDSSAYVHAGGVAGAGGMPYGSSGSALLLLSGGIDSPVAGHMIAKRGAKIAALHFESPPYTSERAREKVFALADIMSVYMNDNLNVYAANVAEIQEHLRARCDEEYFTLLLRRSMMRIASAVAEKFGCGALVTGESLGQVASQTMNALRVTEDAATLPILRPCIGLDKEEIVVRARKIGTFETSILPFEDCCTVFTPRHPKTHPELSAVIAQEQKAAPELAALEEAAVNGVWKRKK